MANIYPLFKDCLQEHVTSLPNRRAFNLQNVGEFMKEAYRINRHISELYLYLQSIRQQYLFTGHPGRRKHGDSFKKPKRDDVHLSDAQRTQIDAEAKQLLRELNAAIERLSNAEQIRQSTEAAVTLKSRARLKLGPLGKWAGGGAGGANAPKSAEERVQEAMQSTIKVHRESVIWYLQQKLQKCGTFQSTMMEIRLSREIEKSKSALHKARDSVMLSPMMEEKSSAMDDIQQGNSIPAQPDLSQEQLQVLKQENRELLKHYEDTLDQVRSTEQSLMEISELQSTLAANLSIQASNIERLVEDSHMTTENVSGGNKELKRAAERRSTAQMVFYVTCVMCATLITWDWFI